MANTHSVDTPLSDPASVLESAVSQFNGLIWTTDAAMVITSSYGRGHADLGIEQNQFVGSTLAEYFGTTDPNFPLFTAFYRVMAGESVMVELHWQERDYRSHLQPLADVSGTVTGCLALTRDVTEAKLLDRTLPQYIAQMRAATERPPDYVIQIDADWKITYAQPSDHGEMRDDVIGTPMHQWIRPETRPFVEDVLRQMMSTGQPQHMEIPAIGPGGADCWYDVRLRPVKEEDKVVGGVVIVYDITDRKAVEQQLRESQQELERRVTQRTKELTELNRQLRESEKRLQSILDNAPAMVYMKDLQGRYMLVNSRFTQMFHVTHEEVRGRTDFDIFPDEMAKGFRDNDLHVIAGQVPCEFDEVAPHDDGPHHYISVKFPLFDSGGKPYALCGISTDITDRKQAQEKLRGEEQLLRKLLELRERERQLISYEIHDGFVQDVVAAKMLLEARGADETDSGLLAPERREAIRNLLANAIEEGRRMISELRPMILDEQGIVGSIEYLAAEHYKNNDMQVRFTHQVAFGRLPPLLEGAVFRIVQEALNNVLRHSQVTTADVRLWQEDRRLLLEVRDGGIGFDLGKVPPDRFGIRGIVERARLFGGVARVESRPGIGTRITAELPMDDVEGSNQNPQSPQTSQ